MTPDTQRSPRDVSQGVLGGLVRLYEVGGMQLVFVGVGLILMLAGRDNIVTTVVGALVVVGSLALYVYAKVRRERVYRRRERMTQATHEVAVELTEAIGTIQALAFKHVSAIDHTMPILERLPLPGAKERIGALKDWSAVVSNLAGASRSLVSDVEEALAKEDAGRLQAYSLQLKQLNGELKKVLGGH
jgi:hypothetical protein